MAKIAIIGFGYVGSAYHRVFPDAVIYDPLKGYKDKKAVNQCGLAIICVPTPSKSDGSADISLVEEAVAWLKTPLIVIKSTVPPGTTKKLKKKYKKRVVFSPEYIGESTYWSPYNWTAENEPFVIVGGDRKDTIEVLRVFKAMGGPTKQYFQTDSTTAELTKYMENSFYATKITFCNEFYEIAKALGVDYNELRELWLADPRINRMHTLVFEDKRGFAGKCFPKDVMAIAKTAEDVGYEPKLIKQVLKSNTEFQSLNANGNGQPAQAGQPKTKVKIKSLSS